MSVKVELSNSEGTVVHSETKKATTNDFGILSLTVGDGSTFEDFDWTKLPLFISATVDGTLIGKSQILTVPIAEHAKHTGELTKEILCKTWSFTMYYPYISGYDRYTYIFNDDMTCKYIYESDDSKSPYFREEMNGTYVIENNLITIFGFIDTDYDVEFVRTLRYIPKKNILIEDGDFSYIYSPSMTTIKSKSFPCT